MSFEASVFCVTLQESHAAVAYRLLLYEDVLTLRSLKEHCVSERAFASNLV